MKFNNQCNGYGRFIFADGKYYEGTLMDNKFNGYGKMVDAEGKVT